MQSSIFDPYRSKATSIDAVYAYWLSLRRDGDAPQRSDFNPFAIPRQLPDVALLDVLAPRRYRVRVAGEHVTLFSDRRLKGREVDASLYGPATPVAIRALEATRTAKECVFLEGDAIFNEKSCWGHFKLLLLPFAEADGRISRILATWIIVDEFVWRPVPRELPALKLRTFSTGPLLLDERATGIEH